MLINARQLTAIYASTKPEKPRMQPTFLITDGCVSYAQSIKTELPETAHVRLRTIRDKRINNNIIERLNGTVRDRIKTMRGLHSERTADEMTAAIANYYNFIRPHSAIGTTPAQAAGIKQEPNWRELIKQNLIKQSAV